MEFAIILALFMHDNQEFLKMEAERRADGYVWEQIEEGCREPYPGFVDGKDYISQGKTDTHPGYVCHQLVKK